MKGSDIFQEGIKKYLDEYAENDSVFKAKYTAKEFKLETCIDYIFTTVKNSGINGFDDSEIFSMAVHYVDEYQTENFDINSGVRLNVVVNHKVELTPEEIEKAKEEAKKTILRETRAQMHKKPKKVTKQVTNTQTLF